MNDEFARDGKCFGYIEKEKLFAQVRSGKLIQVQCDSINERVEEIWYIMVSLGRRL